MVIKRQATNPEGQRLTELSGLLRHMKREFEPCVYFNTVTNQFSLFPFLESLGFLY